MSPNDRNTTGEISRRSAPTSFRKSYHLKVRSAGNGRQEDKNMYEKAKYTVKNGGLVRIYPEKTFGIGKTFVIGASSRKRLRKKAHSERFFGIFSHSDSFFGIKGL